MAAAPANILAKNRRMMEVVSKTIYHLEGHVGMGQTVKACLQSLIGSIFSGTFKPAALAAKADVSGQVLFNVVSSSGVDCGITNTALENIIDRKFDGNGGHINTMHKDLTISLNMAEELEVPLHTASTAMQIFHAGKSKHPNGDNWACTQVNEEIIGAELPRNLGGKS